MNYTAKDIAESLYKAGIMPADFQDNLTVVALNDGAFFIDVDALIECYDIDDYSGERFILLLTPEANDFWIQHYDEIIDELQVLYRKNLLNPGGILQPHRYMTVNESYPEGRLIKLQ